MAGLFAGCPFLLPLTDIHSLRPGRRFAFTNATTYTLQATKMEYTTEDPTHATPENTRVIASNYACMAITLIVLGARAWKCVTWRRKIGLDDIALFLALLAAIVESALTEYAVKRGLGTFIRPGNSARLQSVSEVRINQPIELETMLTYYS